MNLLLISLVINIWLQNSQQTVIPRKCMDRKGNTKDCELMKHDDNHKDRKDAIALDIEEDSSGPNLALNKQPTETKRAARRHQVKEGYAPRTTKQRRLHQKYMLPDPNEANLLRKRGFGRPYKPPRPTTRPTRPTTRPKRPPTTQTTKATNEDKRTPDIKIEVEKTDVYHFHEKDSKEKEEPLKLKGMSKMKEGPVVILLTHKKPS